MRDLRFALGVARTAHDYAAIAAIGRKIAPLDLWGRQHQPRDPTQLGAGVALAIVGGATLIAGLVALIAGELSNCSSGGNGLNFSFGPDCAGDHALTTALVSIPLIVTARKTVDTTPRARLDVGLTHVGLSVSF